MASNTRLVAFALPRPIGSLASIFIFLIDGGLLGAYSSFRHLVSKDDDGEVAVPNA